MAPEQFEGGTATPKSDQFAYAVSLFEALTGERPFSEPGTFDAVAERAASLPAGVRGPILRALAVDPGARWPTMDALVDALDRSRRARGRRLAFIGAAAAAVAAVTVVVVSLPGDAARCDRGPESSRRRSGTTRTARKSAPRCSRRPCPTRRIPGHAWRGRSTATPRAGPSATIGSVAPRESTERSPTRRWTFEWAACASVSTDSEVRSRCSPAAARRVSATP